MNILLQFRIPGALRAQTSEPPVPGRWFRLVTRASERRAAGFGQQGVLQFYTASALREVYFTKARS